MKCTTTVLFLLRTERIGQSDQMSTIYITPHRPFHSHDISLMELLPTQNVLRKFIKNREGDVKKGHC